MNGSREKFVPSEETMSMARISAARCLTGCRCDYGKAEDRSWGYAMLYDIHEYGFHYWKLVTDLIRTKEVHCDYIIP